MIFSPAITVIMFLSDYHLMTYFGFLLDFFGGRDLGFNDLSPLTSRFFSCVVVSLIWEAYLFLTLRQFSNCDFGSNLSGVCAIIWFCPSDPTGWLWNVNADIFAKL